MNLPALPKYALFAATLMAFCALALAVQSSESGAPPGTIDESVPPASNNYALGPDSKPHPSVAAGSTFQFEMTDSKIFPGTVRTITVYVPAAYHADKPACVYVGLDGLGFNAPVVFDNLIAQAAMPVTIGIGLTPGAVNSAAPPRDPRYDRSLEFDSLDDRLARFLVEEVLPEVERHHAPDGRAILLSKDPNDRAIGGGSTGGIGSFTVAWQRPDAFRRVFSAIGTFVGMRGGEQYYVLVRKTEPKPIRIFLQDGAHDGWGGGLEMGDWWMSNLTMNRALEFAGYDVRHVWGAGTHNGNQANAVFPDAMRWLWRDWPVPVKSGQSQNPVLQAILKPSEDWQIVREGCAPFGALAADPKGRVFYRNGGLQEIPSADRVSTHGPERDGGSACAAGGGAFAFDAAGKRYLARPGGGIDLARERGSGGAHSILAPDLHLRSFIVRSNGDIYAAVQSVNRESEIWRITAGGRTTRLDAGLKGVSSVALTPDGLWLFAAQSLSRSGLSYRVTGDGMLDAREPFYTFYIPSWADDSGAGEIAMDREGRAYVATRMGVQIFDRNGRVTAILPLPGNAAATGLTFGGPDFATLYVSAGTRVYRRILNTVGAPPWSAPITLPPWGAG